MRKEKVSVDCGIGREKKEDHFVKIQSRHLLCDRGSIIVVWLGLLLFFLALAYSQIISKYHFCFLLIGYCHMMAKAKSQRQKNLSRFFSLLYL